MPNVGFLLVMVAIFIFVVGFTAGYIFENVAVAYTNQQLEEMRVAVDNLQLQEMFVASESADCNLIYASLGSISYNLNEMVDQLKSTHPGTEEFEKSKVSAEFLSLRAWLLARDIRKSCWQQIVPILFIYSDSAESESQDTILKELKAEYEGVLVYSIDFYADQPALNLIKDAYGVDSAPSIIISKKNVGQMSKADLETIIVQELNINTDNES